MYNTIVVGTDGSPTASTAVEHALRLASTSGGIVHAVTAYRPLSERQVYDRQRGLPPHARSEVDEAHAARELLGRIAKQAADAGVAVELHARVGDAAAMLVAVAEEVAADVVVVGNKGMVGVRRVLGSIPNDVAHRAPCSVLIVGTTERS